MINLSRSILVDRIAYPVMSFPPSSMEKYGSLKIEVFIWLVLHDKICTRDFLDKRNLIDNDLVGFFFFSEKPLSIFSFSAIWNLEDKELLYERSKSGSNGVYMPSSLESLMIQRSVLIRGKFQREAIYLHFGLRNIVGIFSWLEIFWYFKMKYRIKNRSLS